MIRIVVVAALIVLLNGCGPMSMPVPIRLDADQQKEVDSAWEHLLGWPDRYDRAFVLDSVLYANLHQSGVDRIHFVSEKKLKRGSVVMITRYDRESPALDEFTLVYLDGDGDELRRERYTGRVVRERIAELWCHEGDPGQPTATAINKEECRSRMEAREEEIMGTLFPERAKSKKP